MTDVVEDVQKHMHAYNLVQYADDDWGLKPAGAWSLLLPRLLLGGRVDLPEQVLAAIRHGGSQGLIPFA